MHFLCDFLRVFFDDPYVFLGNVHRRDDTCGIAGMYSGKFDMLHNCRNKCMISVADSIGFTFQGMVQETVDQYRTVRRHAYSSFHITFHTLIVVYDFHAASAKDIRRTYHDRITDLFGNGKGFCYRSCHSGFRHRDSKLVHHSAEQIAVFRQIDDRRRSSKDLHAVFLKLRSKVQRSLSAELCDNSCRLFFLVDT